MPALDLKLTLQQALAHSRNTEGLRQSLEEHLKNVSRLAERFGAAFEQADLGSALGYFHDLGKTKTSWQQRLLQLEAGQTLAWNEIQHDHKMAAAAYVYDSSPLLLS